MDEQLGSLDQRMQELLHAIALQHGGRPPEFMQPPQQPQVQPMLQNGFSGDQPSGGDPYANDPMPARTGPVGAPYGAYRQEGKPWTQMQFNDQGQFAGISGYRRPNSPIPAAEPQQAGIAPQAAASAAPASGQTGTQSIAVTTQQPRVPTTQDALNYLNKLGYATSSPDVMRLVPKAQEYLYKQGMDRFKQGLDIANTQSQIASREGATQQLVDTGTGYTLFDKGTGKSGGQVISKDIAGKERAEIVGKGMGQAETDLPRVMQNADQTLKVINDIRNHPGIDLGTGWLGVAAEKTGGIPGTDQRSFVDQVNQLKGKTFLEAYNTLKGGGQITEVEGKKATDALARLDMGQSKQDFLKALGDLESVIKIGMGRAEKQAGVAPQGRAATQSQTQAPAQNAAPIDGAKQAPDGNWYVPDPGRPGKYLQVR